MTAGHAPTFGSPVSRNTAGGTNAEGGGIAAYGSLNLTGSAVTGNTATGTNARGGGILNFGTVTRITSPVVANIPDQCGTPSTVPGC
ncbi:hypothetical protein ACF1A5_00105 [Streptomyces sp. NPDC014864]|uniref:hypothetical protein n=1 Tax=Streptomyces sp. NPDC014864 TaxID=3364924 RepID=UPI0036F8B426